LAEALSASPFMSAAGPINRKSINKLKPEEYDAILIIPTMFNYFSLEFFD
jgi:hypothetical protein